MGVWMVFLSVVYLFSILSAFIGIVLQYAFPLNRFTIISSIVLITANSLLMVRILWFAIPKFNFWTTIEFIIIMIFFISLNITYIRRDVKE
jgi:hypothetical protein